MSWRLIGIAMFLVGIAIAAATLRYWQKTRPNRHHRRMIGQARRARQRMMKMEPGAVITYMRKMAPHAVEEIVLESAQAAGHPIKRNKAYTGDGGIDGQIFIDGAWHLVQTKRYGKSINPRHVTDFSEVCAKRGQPGLFIHCGRTGDKSRANAAAHVRFVSGQAIVDLIAGKSLSKVQAA